MSLQEGGNFTPNPRLVSPGVFTRELDQSFLTEGVNQIGGAIVAPFPKGPGFSPVTLNTQSDLESIFGKPDGILYGPYTAQQYLQQQGTVTVVRVGGLGGYEQRSPLALVAYPGQYQRFEESGSYSGSLVGVSIQVSGSDFATIEGTLVANFVSGEYSGSTVQIGTFSASVVDPVIDNGALVSGEILQVSSSVSNLLIPSTGLLSTFGQLESTTLCGNTVYKVNGSLLGEYGKFDPDSWVPDSVDSLDECNNIITGSSEKKITTLAVLANTAFDSGQNLYGFSGSVLLSGSNISSEYSLCLKTSYLNTQTGQVESSSYGTYSFSTDKSSPKYFTNVFGASPVAGQVPVPIGSKIEAAYTYKHFKNTIDQVNSEMISEGKWKLEVVPVVDGMKFVQDGVQAGLEDSAYDLRNAETPWINSQNVSSYGEEDGPSTASKYNLFKVHTMTDGTGANTLYKIEISNVKSAGTVPGSDYGTFTLAVRDFNDTDRKPVFLEIFNNLNLDPDSADYVARRIGDRYNYINSNGKILEFGDYSNQSRYIRIEMTSSPYPKTSMPYGFDAYADPVSGFLTSLATIPKMTFTSASIYSKQLGRYASGIVFSPAPVGSDTELAGLYPDGTSQGSELDNVNYFAPIPVGASAGRNEAFDLEEFCGISPIDTVSTVVSNAKKRKFILGFQGGFDGSSPSVPVLVGNDIISTNQQGLNCSTNTSVGTLAYMQCLNALSNADEFDINLLVTPGINYEYNPFLITQGVELCENRGDAFYVFDIASNKPAGQSSIDTVVSLASEFDTSYAATYYPWVKIRDVNTNRIILSPPSVVLPAVYASNDREGAEWFAPAGLSRGGVQQAVQVVDRLTHADRDVLYEGRVNPIAAFPGQGISVWGQKTLQVRPSALDRINVRRLLISVKKFVASTSKFLAFEQNVQATRNRFLNLVNPFLRSVQERSGVYSFRIIADESINTPELVDRNIMYFKLGIQPTKTAEMIVVDFAIDSSGASFTE
jgi:hypothetical protein